MPVEPFHGQYTHGAVRSICSPVSSFDEPNLKATFDFNITIPGSYTALSNMPESKSETAGTGLKRVTFETSPKMSTYVSTRAHDVSSGL